MENETDVSEVFDLKTRILTAIVGITVGVTVLFLNNTIIYPLFVSLISAMSVYEVLSVCQCRKYPVHCVMSLVFAVSMPILSYYNISMMWRFFTASLLCFLMFAGYVADHKKLPFDKLAVMIAAASLISLSVTCLVSLRNMDKVHGICYVVMSLMAAWVPDAGAYFVGTAFGKHKLCPDISPKKTVEGAVGGLVVTSVVFALYAKGYQMFMHSFKGVDFEINYAGLIIIMIIAALISMVGDLSASLLKREYGIKDFGNLLPGHGGAVDRFDSVYFVLPYMMLIFSAFKIFE